MPVAVHKTEGPSTALVFLGILIDTVKMEIRLPADKLARLQLLINQWGAKTVCIKRDLLSLLGHLQHACKVVPAGRSFLRRMINTSTYVKELYHHIRLNREFRSDLRWWSLFLADWNGTRIMSSRSKLRPDFTLTSDASGSWGCGAFTSLHEWFQFTWPPSWAGIHITVKELLPIVMACAVWGNQWSSKSVKCFCDNAAVVAILNSGTSKDMLAMHLMRCLVFFRAHYNIFLFAEHIPGKNNIAADSLSRDNLPLFFQVCPLAARVPSPISEELVQALVLVRPDWTAPTWRALFRSILKKD